MRPVTLMCFPHQAYPLNFSVEGQPTSDLTRRGWLNRQEAPQKANPWIAWPHYGWWRTPTASFMGGYESTCRQLAFGVENDQRDACWPFHNTASPALFSATVAVMDQHPMACDNRALPQILLAAAMIRNDGTDACLHYLHRRQQHCMVQQCILYGATKKSETLYCATKNLNHCIVQQKKIPAGKFALTLYFATRILHFCPKFPKSVQMNQFEPKCSNLSEKSTFPQPLIFQRWKVKLIVEKISSTLKNKSLWCVV